VPYSTPEKPKQFLHITHGDRTMIQKTFDRIREFVPAERIYVSTNDRYSGLVHEQLPEIPKQNIIGEPLKKNTAPAIALVTYLIHKKDPDAITLFVPADHYVADIEGAISSYKKATTLAGGENTLVTFGITPTFPSPDYGYIKRGDACSKAGAFKVERFVEKPDVEKANGYLKDGGYFWNSGMFVWKTKSLIDALSKHMPELTGELLTLKTDAKGAPQREWINTFFTNVESISIDYGVMEKASNVVMLPFGSPWSDVGTWKGLSELADRFSITLPEVVQTHLKEKIG
jgi:mannose-1-phosphate guanylyltransferase